MRRAFGMIQVIMMMILLATILTITLKYAKITTKQTSDLYSKEQAQLFMQSAIELALLGISDHNRSVGGCVNEIKIISKDKRYIADINITNYYLSKTSGCDRENIIQTEESNGFVGMDIVVETNNTHPKNTTPIRLIKHTVQRP